MTSPPAVRYLSSLFRFGRIASPNSLLIRAILYEPGHVIVMLVAAGIAFFGVQVWDLSRKVTPLRATLALTVLAWSLVAMSAAIVQPVSLFSILIMTQVSEVRTKRT